MPRQDGCKFARKSDPTMSNFGNLLANCWSLNLWVGFLLKDDIEILLRKMGARLNLKVDLMTLHTYPETGLVRAIFSWSWLVPLPE